ncbi:VOC family protein [Amycolatopsis sp. NPDC004079]|uniref:VOC family protein n=1 Tax=Amycolatopsis sp. NPDC004079 TaxID=3154549 RepID=UPI0033A8F1D0
MAGKNIPDLYPGITAHIVSKDAQAHVDLLGQLFGAEIMGGQRNEEGKWWYCELRINEGRFMVSDEFPELGFLSPDTVGGTPVMLHVYVDDVDATHQQMLDAGGTSLMAPADRYWGDRSGQVRDSFGHMWTVSTRKETLKNDEIVRRGDEEVKRLSHA